MARKQVSQSNIERMSVLGESTAVYPVSGAKASLYSAQPHDVEFASWLESSRQCQPFERRRSTKRPRSKEDQQQDVSAAKKFINEEIVATHLQQLNLASSTNAAPSITTDVSSITSGNTTSQSCSQSPSTATSSSSWPLPLLSVPRDLLSSAGCSSLLASAAKSRPLSIKTVASCPQSLENTKEGAAWRNDVNLSEVGCGSDFYLLEKRRTSPKHKRPLDEDELEEESVRTGVTVEGMNVLTAEPRKRSKVDVRVTATTELMRDCQTQFSLSSSESDTLSRCSSIDTDSSSSNNKRWEAVILDDGSDSSDGGTESGLGPERPLSLWIAPELQAISSTGPRQDLLPPAILEKYHSPKGMEIVPWVGGHVALSKVEEKGTEALYSDTTHMYVRESSEENQTQQQTLDNHQQLWTGEDSLINDISMEP